jgi:scyllo-inositol 2-dehydrogenase (NADP+)
VKSGLDVQESQLRAGLDPAAPDFGVEPEASRGIWISNEDGRRERTPSIRGSWREFYRRLKQSIEHGAQAPLTAGEAREVVRIIEAALLSSREGRRILNPPRSAESPRPWDKSPAEDSIVVSDPALSKVRRDK